MNNLIPSGFGFPPVEWRRFGDFSQVEKAHCALYLAQSGLSPLATVFSPCLRRRPRISTSSGHVSLLCTYSV
jgi:hypothetical protein